MPGYARLCWDVMPPGELHVLVTAPVQPHTTDEPPTLARGGRVVHTQGRDATQPALDLRPATCVLAPRSGSELCYGSPDR
jgi:hypothetical protein